MAVAQIIFNLGTPPLQRLHIFRHHMGFGHPKLYENNHLLYFNFMFLYIWFFLVFKSMQSLQYSYSQKTADQAAYAMFIDIYKSNMKFVLILGQYLIG